MNSPFSQAELMLKSGDPDIADIARFYLLNCPLVPAPVVDAERLRLFCRAVLQPHVADHYSPELKAISQFWLQHHNVVSSPAVVEDDEDEDRALDLLEEVQELVNKAFPKLDLMLEYPGYLCLHLPDGSSIACGETENWCIQYRDTEGLEDQTIDGNYRNHCYIGDHATDVQQIAYALVKALMTGPRAGDIFNGRLG